MYLYTYFIESPIRLYWIVTYGCCPYYLKVVLLGLYDVLGLHEKLSSFLFSQNGS